MLVVLGAQGSNDMKAKAVAQYNADPGLLAEFEQSRVSGESFDYTRSVTCGPVSATGEQITAYLSTIQRGGLTQSFGCLLVIEESTFRIIGFSENCFELLGLEFESAGSLIGVDARGLFTPPSATSLVKAVAWREVSLLNPVWVYSRVTQRPFYAILHRIDVGILIDLEPSRSSDATISLAGAVQSQKLAVCAISRLQALPGGDIGLLCNTLVDDVQKLTGYDRVMVYKFHEDEHCEVVSEVRRSDLEPYLGLHYPATDIPQAARFLFKQNRVRIICDCTANPVRVIQSEELKKPLSLVNSTLRSPHSCHTQYMSNMGSIASLTMAVIVKGNSSSELWGLVVCHNTSPRYVPFPLRYACEFLIQAFALQLHMELQLASQMAEKQVLRMQTLLCDMLLRDIPLGIVTQSPSIIDLVKCDGAAMCYGDGCWLLGVTPTESQVKELVEWLITNHDDSTGLSTESLADFGYPGAVSLGDSVCGMATARVVSNCVLFWFRSHSAKEVKWGGAKHHPEHKDDGGRMHPRLSFNAFVEVAKSRSLPWEISEISAIQSLQHTLRDLMMDLRSSKALTCASQNDIEMTGLDEISSFACEMVRLVETSIVPIFGIDLSGNINGWNAKIAELTGLSRNEAMGKSLGDEVIHQESRQAFETLFCRALQGEEDKNDEFKFRVFGESQQTSVVYIRANTCTSRDYANNIIGVCFVGQDITSEKVIMDKCMRLQGDYEAIIQSLSPSVPAIFSMDDNAYCVEWNAAMEILTGWMKHEVTGRTVAGDIFGGLCRLKSQETLTRFTILIYQAITVRDTDQFPFGFFDKKGNFIEVLLTLSKRLDSGGKVLGCFCFLQVVTPETKSGTEEAPREDAELSRKVKGFTYVLQEMKNTLNGIRFIHKLLQTTATTENQKQVLGTSVACEKQMTAIIDDMGDEGVNLSFDEFVLGNLLDAVVSQVMIPLQEKNLQMFNEFPEEMKRLLLCGDQARLQLVLSDLLHNIIRYASSPNGWVEFKVLLGLKLIQDGSEIVRIQFRMTHPGKGLQPSLIKEMFEDMSNGTSPEGLGLNLSRKLLNKMNGQVCYIREKMKCYFVVDLEMTSKFDRRKVRPPDTSMRP